MTIDRANRDRLAAAIRRYLAEEITAFEFDEEIHRIPDGGDTTVRAIACELWFHYDDCTDHKVVLNHHEWNLFHRLLLILDSDACIEKKQWRIWSFAQLIAAIGLIGFCFATGWLGFGRHLLLLAIPFGVLALIVSRWWRTSVPVPPERELELMPFASLAELRRVRLSVKEFSKPVFPSSLATRRVRSRWAEKLGLIPFWGMYFMFSPLILLFFMFPHRIVRTSVPLASAESSAVTSPNLAANIP